MEILTLKAQSRGDVGKVATKKNRVEEMIPCVLYGGERETTHILLPELIVTNLMRTAGEHSLIQLEVEGAPPQLSLIAEVQHHPVTDRILHIDFKAIKRGQLIDVPVPIEFIGEAKGTAGGGSFMANIYQINVRATPDNIPSSIQIDITEMTEDQALHISDVEVGENIEIIDDPDLTVASIVKPQAILEPEEEEGIEVEGLEGEGEGEEVGEGAEETPAEKPEE